MTWAAELKAWREKHGLTQKRAAEALLVPERTLEDWEQGRMEPYFHTKEALRRLMARRRDA